MQFIENIPLRVPEAARPEHTNAKNEVDTLKALPQAKILPINPEHAKEAVDTLPAPLNLPIQSGKPAETPVFQPERSLKQLFPKSPPPKIPDTTESPEANGEFIAESQSYDKKETNSEEGNLNSEEGNSDSEEGTVPSTPHSSSQESLPDSRPTTAAPREIRVPLAEAGFTTPPPGFYAEQDISEESPDEDWEQIDESDDDSEYTVNTVHLEKETTVVYDDGEVEPSSAKAALKDPRWVTAMNKEMENLRDNLTFSLEKLPPHEKPVTMKWVFKIKRSANGKIDQFKAKAVARGFTQIYGVNYWEIFAPVARAQSFKMIIAIYALNMHNTQVVFKKFDAKGAFLKGKMTGTPIYCASLPGYEQYDADGDLYYWKLNKSIYGLKQAGRVWFETLIWICVFTCCYFSNFQNSSVGNQST